MFSVFVPVIGQVKVFAKQFRLHKAVSTTAPVYYY